MKSFKVLGLGAIALGLFAGCASNPPRELMDARAAYASASRSPTAGFVQTDVYEAKKSLDRAEQRFADDGDSIETRDLAYIAQRKALSAQVKGDVAQSIQQKKMTEAQFQQWREQQAQLTRGQLDMAKNQLSAQQRQLESERQARAAAEEKTREALSKIQGMQQKQDDQGRMVLTLNGSVLFATGKSELLPAAQQRLGQVVDALKADQRSITILGHTDNVGSDDKNMQLSQQRADAVKRFLTTHGIPEDRVKAQGMGETQPIADNKNAEGRANNRRVEIVLEDMSQSGGTRGQTQGPDTGSQKGKSGAEGSAPTDPRVKGDSSGIRR